MLDLRGTVSVVQVPLTKNMYATVDLNDWFIVSKFKWHVVIGHSNYYARNSVYKRNYMHNLIMNPDNGKIVDHIDCNGLNNRRCNLRIVKNSQNSYNARKAKNRTSKYKGVCWHKVNQKWFAYIVFKRHHYHLGYFDNEIDAAMEYDSMASVMFEDLARLNFPEGVLS